MFPGRWKHCNMRRDLLYINNGYLIHIVNNIETYGVHITIIYHPAYLAGIMIKVVLSFACVLFWSHAAFTQTRLRGKVSDKWYDRVIMAATIKNISKDRMAQSDMGGNYKIPAAPGDIVSFSSAGYITDTIVVTANMLTASFDVFLARHVIELSNVEIGDLNRYQADSISRREEFNDVLTKRNTKLAGGKGNTPTDGVGITFSPLTFFSKKERNERRFKKMFERQEEELYIDFKFPFDYVSKLTGLQGDSLRSFMLQYRPDYAFCRRSSKADMLLYINDSYRAFMHRESTTDNAGGKKRRER